MIADMRSKMLLEIVQLRDSLFKRKKDKQPSFRADMFNSLEMLDPKVAEVVQMHISEVTEKHKQQHDVIPPMKKMTKKTMTKMMKKKKKKRKRRR